MIRMAYLDDQNLQNRLIREYQRIIITNQLEDNWENAKEKYNVLNNLPFTLRQIVVGKFSTLIRVYNKFDEIMSDLEVNTQNDIKTYLRDEVFKYKGSIHDKDIAPFFRKYASELKIHTCHYCDMAYINVYKYEDDNEKVEKSHFDLDHVIERSSCPLLSLSLFNLVPSCQVCNSRIKYQKGLSKDKYLLNKFSPTSSGFSFDESVVIELYPKEEKIKPYMSNRDAYQIHFNCQKDEDYKEYVKTLHLQERYEYHKVEALRLKDLQEKYPPANIEYISNLLGIPREEVKEDLFGEKFADKEHRCFKKLRRDILKY